MSSTESLLAREVTDEQMAKLYAEGLRRALDVFGPLIETVVNSEEAILGLPPRIESLAWLHALIYVGIMVARSRNTPAEAIEDVFDMVRKEMAHPGSAVMNPPK